MKNRYQVTGEWKLLTLLLLLYSIINTGLQAQSLPTKKLVYVFKLNQEIFNSAERLVDRALKEAIDLKADVVIMELNTFGGALDVADHIRKKILDAKPTMIVYINDNAASAGALISIACDSIYMHSGAKIGSASVVNENGQIMPDKYQSYMRAFMRATAEENHRDPKIAEGMVTPNGYLKEVADTGRIIALTTQEAIKYGYCEGEANNIDEVLKLAGITNYELKEYQSSWLDAFIGWLMNPAVSGFLMLIILAGIYFEFQHPGIGLPLFAALGAATLYFAPLYLDGLAANWEILVFLFGIVLLALEIFVIPGFGVAGISGIICIVGGLALAMVRNSNFNFEFVDLTQFAFSILKVLLAMIVAVIAGLMFGGNIFKSKAMKRLVLTATQDPGGVTMDDKINLSSLIGTEGIAVTDLNPSGYVKISENQFDCISDGKFINKGEQVIVHEVKGNYLVVRKK